MSIAIEELVSIYNGLDYDRQVTSLQTLLRSSHSLPESDFTETIPIVPMMTSEKRQDMFKSVWNWRFLCRLHKQQQQGEDQHLKQAQREKEGARDQELAEDFLDEMLKNI